MTNPYLVDALASLSQSTGVLRSLTFTSRAVLPRCVLAPDDWFETHLIRDAAQHELALFRPNPASYSVVQLDVDDPLLLVGDDPEANRLAVAKRKAPQRANHAQDTADPSAGREQPAARNQPERCLLTAQKLLDVYAMPRAQEHVEALHSQLQGLMESIAATEQALKRPPSRTAPQPQHDQSYYRRLELEDEIKRERLELLALEQIKADKQAEIEAIASAAAATKADAAASKPKPNSRPTPRSSLSAMAGTTATTTATAAGPTRPARTPRISASSASPRGGARGPPRRSAGSTATTSTTAATAIGGSSPTSPPPSAAPHSAALLGAQGPSSSKLDPSVSSSPARRPIGNPRPSVPTAQSAMKRRVEAARAKIQASAQATPNRKEAFALASHGSAARREDGGAGAQVASSGSRSDLPPPVPVVPTLEEHPEPSRPATRKHQVSLPLPVGVTVAELEGANQAIWFTLGDANGLKAWARKWARDTKGGDNGSDSDLPDWTETVEILNFALAESATSTVTGGAGAPGSPSGHSITSFATSTTAAGAGGGDEGGGTAPPPLWTPAQVVEARLCLLLLSTFAGCPVGPVSSPAGEAAGENGDEDLPALNIILRETAIPLSSSTAGAGGVGGVVSSRKTPHLAMSVLKAHLGRFAKRRGWTEEMGTTAVYALVSKQAVKIDRRGREGAAVGFKAAEL